MTHIAALTTATTPTPTDHGASGAASSPEEFAGALAQARGDVESADEPGGRSDQEAMATPEAGQSGRRLSEGDKAAADGLVDAAPDIATAETSADEVVEGEVASDPSIADAIELVARVGDTTSTGPTATDDAAVVLAMTTTARAAINPVDDPAAIEPEVEVDSADAGVPVAEEVTGAVAPTPDAEVPVAEIALLGIGQPYEAGLDSIATSSLDPLALSTVAAAVEGKTAAPTTDGPIATGGPASAEDTPVLAVTDAGVDVDPGLRTEHRSPVAPPAPPPDAHADPAPATETTSETQPTSTTSANTAAAGTPADSVAPTLTEVTPAATPTAAPVTAAAPLTAQTAPAPTADAAAPAAPPPPAPTTPAAQVAEVLRDVRRLADGTHRLSLRLHPEELGAVQLEVALRDGRLHLRAVAETEAGRAVLNSSLPELRTELREAGVDTGSLEVGDQTARGGADAKRGARKPTPDGRRPDPEPSTRNQPTEPARSSTSSLVDIRL